MGNLTRYEGEIRIDPPMNWAMIKKVNELPRIAEGSEVELVIEEDEAESDVGVTQIMTCAAVIPCKSDPYKGYRVEDCLKDIAKLLNANGYFLDGYFECQSEEGGDPWRLVAHKNEIVRVDPEITWPMP